MSDQPTFSLQEAADIAGVKRDTLRQWLQRGHLSVERGAGQHRWTWPEVFYAGDVRGAG
jgi:excisionase family DNA binding protein